LNTLEIAVNDLEGADPAQVPDFDRSSINTPIDIFITLLTTTETSKLIVVERANETLQGRRVLECPDGNVITDQNGGAEIT